MSSGSSASLRLTKHAMDQAADRLSPVPNLVLGGRAELRPPIRERTLLQQPRRGHGRPEEVLEQREELRLLSSPRDDQCVLMKADCRSTVVALNDDSQAANAGTHDRPRNPRVADSSQEFRSRIDRGGSRDPLASPLAQRDAEHAEKAV